ncbi:MAG: cupin domain-containing protein [Blastocatellia bacterium]
MKRTILSFALLLTGLGAGWTLARISEPAASAQASAPQQGYIHERDADVAKSGPAPHNGPGRSTGHDFFAKAPGFKINFRKRVLHPGAAIGYHLQKEDEVYYILGGTGIMQMNGKEFPVKAGDAILTRPGSSHGLKQTGDGDLTLIINYERKAAE